MKIIEPSHVFETPIAGEAGRNLLALIERAARTCYKSECSFDDPGVFVRKIAQVKKHESVIEHASASIRFICDRGVSHELVRHRLVAFSQESTRYCNYGSAKFKGELTFIRPFFFVEASEEFWHWREACRSAEEHYLALLECGVSPQEARSVLPNSLKTELVMTCNLREWRHVLRLRCAKTAHPQMQQLMRPVLEDFQKHLPELFDDLNPDA